MRILWMVRRGLELPNAERWGFVRAYVQLVRIDLLLRARGFKHVAERARSGEHRRNGLIDVVGLRRTASYVRWIDAASQHHLVRARCLHRSLALQDWLSRDGLPSELRIGVHTEGGELKAHAWVELEGTVVNDRPATVAAFRPLAGPTGQPPNWSDVATVVSIGK